MNNKEKKNAKKTLEIINKIIDYKNNAPIFFHCASKVDKKIRTKDWKKYCRENKVENTKRSRIYQKYWK